MPNGPMRITSGPFEPELYKSEFEVQDGELKVSLKKHKFSFKLVGCPVFLPLGMKVGSKIQETGWRGGEQELKKGKAQPLQPGCRHVRGQQ